MENSILKSVKKVLGIDSTYTAFDEDILMHINSVFATLHRLGIGPEGGYHIEDDTALWTAFIGTDQRKNSVKTYVCLKVRLVFDPPQTSYLIEAMRKQIEELEWRINEWREFNDWTSPVTTPPSPGSVLDGGAP
jgi:hypothetical protein